LASTSARTRYFDSKIRPFGFYYCPFLLVGRLGDEFCNTFPHKADIAEYHAMSAKCQPDIHNLVVAVAARHSLAGPATRLAPMNADVCL
jgi:hypothetical protein